MRSNRRHTVEELVLFIELFLEGIPFSQLVHEQGLSLSISSFRMYVRRYVAHGPQGLQSVKQNNTYSEDFKEEVVLAYLSKKGSIKELAVQYGVPSYSTVHSWIKRYTEGKENRTYSPKPEVYRMEKRKTTWDERIQIVKNHLENQWTYKETASKYQVPYHSVYQWIQKYKEHGPDGLIDGRGRGKPETTQTKEEKLQAELKRLEARNQWLEMENTVLKKQNEIERELMSKKSGKKRHTWRSIN